MLRVVIGVAWSSAQERRDVEPAADAARIRTSASNARSKHTRGG